MATNDFLPFSGGAGANVLTQAAYLALSTLRTNGFQAGTAQSAQLNKVWRQSSIMSAVLAQLIVDNTGQNAIDDGTTATLLANLKTAVGGRLIGIQVFATVGSFTYTPTVGTSSVVVEAVGGGGAGGGAAATSTSQIASAGGGGSGAYGKGRFTSSFSGVTVTVGAGGAASAAGANAGNPGGTSSFGALLSCPGGTAGGGGPAISSAGMGGISGGPGSAPSGANITGIVGGGGDHGFGLTATQGIGGRGASSPLGCGGHPPGASGVRIAGTGYGSGSSGANNGQSAAALAGIAGQQGIVIVWEFA